MSKNPFELRTEVLELAKEYMDKQIEMNKEYAERMQSIGQLDKENYMESFKPYTFQELMDKAAEMYSFVSKKSNDDTK